LRKFLGENLRIVLQRKIDRLNDPINADFEKNLAQKTLFTPFFFAHLSGAEDRLQKQSFAQRLGSKFFEKKLDLDGNPFFQRVISAQFSPPLIFDFYQITKFLHRQT